ncbi:MAG: inositol monophosphatase family protein [Alphaproteobacteria bacterium]
MQEFLSLANRMADKAGKIIQKYYRQPFDVEHKADHSPVTIADREVEQALRDILAKERPQDGILGEEFGHEVSQNGLTWVIDPIDGTKSFMIGRPTFGTLIALCEADIPKLGIIDQPILKERWVGITGEKTTLNGKPVRTRPCTDFHDARIGSTTPMMFDKLSEFGRAYELFEVPPRMAWGGDCYMYGLIASGFMDIAFEQNLSPYDFAALVPVIKGAGGHISDWRGDELTLNSTGKVIAVGDPNLWPEIERMIRKSPF